MPRIFFGKISNRFPQQFERNFYAGGERTRPWYGGLEPGDYVFPIFDQSVSKLWKVREYTSEPNEINENGSIQFDVVKTFAPISISTGFARYRHFIIDINLVNRLTKSTANLETGFFQINVDADCPPPDKLDFSELRNIYIAVERPFKEPPYRNGDIRIKLDNSESLMITSIEMYKTGVFEQYTPLWSLYVQKSNSEPYSLNQLLQFALQDQAEKKKTYLQSVIDEIKKNGYFTAGSPIGLYDNVLVGRKKTKRRNTATAKEQAQEDVEIDEELSEIDDTIERYSQFAKLLDSNPNLILYGPPGTGKTYAAQRIIESFDNFRAGTKKSFREIKEEGRVDFITFHQSFSYEEFVEGLRPVIPTEDGKQLSEGGSGLSYKIQEGILKQIANKASLGQIKSESKDDSLDEVSEDNRIWKISLGRAGHEDDIYKDCLKTETIAINWFKDENLTGLDSAQIFEKLKIEGSDNPVNDANSIDNFINTMQVGDIVLVFASVTEIRAIGVVKGDYKYTKDQRFPHRRKVKWLREFNPAVNILKYNNGVRLTMKTVYELGRFKFSDINEILNIGKDPIKKDPTSVETPYFLIIDEINRGNISKIFGELITLIEKDKRNVLSCKLPYSQKEFRLPSNLYIIGTMNTSDRSIAVLDVALRRRFYFKEIEPDARIIQERNESSIQTQLITLFTNLNFRITAKLDRDHRIGHYHFLTVETPANLRLVWHYQVIPLLAEYFYNDAKSIAQLIGDDFVDSQTGQIKLIEDDDAFMAAIEKIKS